MGFLPAGLFPWLSGNKAIRQGKRIPITAESAIQVSGQDRQSVLLTSAVFQDSGFRGGNVRTMEWVGRQAIPSSIFRTAPVHHVRKTPRFIKRKSGYFCGPKVCFTPDLFRKETKPGYRGPQTRSWSELGGHFRNHRPPLPFRKGAVPRSSQIGSTVSM